MPKGVIFTVRDNGNSEDLPVESPENSGKGIKIMDSYYRLFEKQHKCKIHTAFTKPGETDASQTGTEVEIRIEYLYHDVVNLTLSSLKTLTGYRRKRLVSVQST